MRKLLIASIAPASLTLPQLASAESPPPPQNQQSMQSQVSNLQQAGFTNVQVMPSSCAGKPIWRASTPSIRRRSPMPHNRSVQASMLSRSSLTS
jgi:hypothetical protein